VTEIGELHRRVTHMIDEKIGFRAGTHLNTFEVQPGAWLIDTVDDEGVRFCCPVDLKLTQCGFARSRDP
jgi:hypothetical protein